MFIMRFRMSISKCIGLICLVSLVSGCGKSKATEEQRVMLGQTLDSAVRVHSAVPSQGQMQNPPGMNALSDSKFAAVNWAASALSSGTATARAPDDETKKMNERLSIVFKKMILEA
jgi:hypothetical protein